jgi:hypothetical protein
MSVQDSIYKSATPKDGDDKTEVRSKETIYKVTLEGIKREIETPDSFAIKYGILTSTPVTKIKFMLRDLPKKVVETKIASKARGALELIEEAGGIGFIEECNPEEVAPEVEIPEEKPEIVEPEEKNCVKCGFPLKNDDEFCKFCLTPLVKAKSQKKKTTLKVGGGGGHQLSSKKLLIYVVLFLFVLLLGLLTR